MWIVRLVRESARVTGLSSQVDIYVAWQIRLPTCCTSYDVQVEVDLRSATGDFTAIRSK